MLGRENIITAEKALDLVLQGLPERAIPVAVLELDEALGRILAADIVAAEDLPPFARSTVDGFAVKAADTFGASDTMPAYLDLDGEVFMGQAADMVLHKGCAVKIPTGGMLPEGADAVVMLEHVQAVDTVMLEIMKTAGPGANVIQPGEDAMKGSTVLKKGHWMRPQDIGACAGIGVTNITAFEKPVVSIISTGDEIIPPTSTPNVGQIRDVNSYLLKGLITGAGGKALRKGIFRDDYDQIRTAVEESMKDSDLVLVSGGTSVGTKDLIAGIISDIGSPGLLFHGISLKPGKPLIGGIIKGIPVFGLPGHPAAVSICFELFILPLLQRLSGRDEPAAGIYKPAVFARLAKNIASTQGREEHVRVQLEKREDGLWAVPVISKSGLITTMVKTDGTVVIPLSQNGIEQGTLVEVRLFR
ncbi:MAG: molybdopterin molybdenumtransferase MoeA [Thermodesulfovibrio sp.]|nr:molybdopterin molybdenumtransferase MoeA [Thermodesulfovibrio sp.]